jgi:hypothetical protein
MLRHPASVSLFPRVLRACDSRRRRAEGEVPAEGWRLEAAEEEESAKAAAALEAAAAANRRRRCWRRRAAEGRCRTAGFNFERSAMDGEQNNYKLLIV